MKLLKLIITLIWLMDIINVPQLHFLDTTIPLNGLFWFLYAVFIGFGTSNESNID